MNSEALFTQVCERNEELYHKLVMAREEQIGEYRKLRAIVHDTFQKANNILMEVPSKNEDDDRIERIMAQLMVLKDI